MRTLCAALQRLFGVGCSGPPSMETASLATTVRARKEAPASRRHNGCAPELTARSDSRICALFTLTEGGELDAFDTLMQVLRIPRVHFQLSDAHRAPRAPELHRALGGWLRSLEGGARCATNGRLL